MNSVLKPSSANPGRALASPWVEQLADLAVWALIEEVMLSPKPGLVDARSRGAHHDLDWMLMCRSAHALRPAFLAMICCAAWRQESVELREELGSIGRWAESLMMQATGGVNTHRGAIWALGLLVSAAAMCPDQLAALKVADRAGSLARIPDRAVLSGTGNPGERACRTHRVDGARGQAQSGFPHVTRLALPALKNWRNRGIGEVATRLNVLLVLMRELDDTCLLARGGKEGLMHVQAKAASVLAAGGAGAPEGFLMLEALVDDLRIRHLSPGGSADLLAATLFLDRLAAFRFSAFDGEQGWSNGT
ncbi:MAG: triphosphoribosyl-dephospho-CoA synthase [Lautropia sp.]|nr:triphosphoribosyl-dephospho-CoA synthase [Lautropia sp.]